MGGVGGAQITILTSDKVCLYQNVPADQAHAITVLLSHGNSPCDEYRKGTLMQNTDQPTTKTNTFNSVGDEVQFRSSTSPCPSPHRITQGEMNQQQQQQLVIGRSKAKLPIARSASVGRCLEKRKERLDASMAVKACEKMDDRSERIAGQVREIVNSERLPVPFSEMDPLVLKTLRSYYRNNRPTPPCPRSRCANVTAFHSLNVCSKTLLLKPVFYCKSCKHKFTLNGRLRTPPIRRQAAPDHSSPSFSSTPWGAEQQLQAVGQTTTHNREHAGKQLEQQQQQAGGEQDLMLEDEAVHNIELTNTSTCAAADGREYAANGYMAEWEEFLLHCADNE